MIPILSCVVLGAAGVAAAQIPGFTFVIDYGPGRNAVSSQNPSCRVRMLAGFSPPDFAFATARWNVLGTEPGWSGNIVLTPFTVGSNPGVINGGSVMSIFAGQLHFPPTILADPVNPAPVWEATWSTSNFTARTVRLQTETHRFDVYVSRSSPISQSRTPVLLPSFAEIRVVPAAGGAIPVLLGLSCARRRTRRPSLDRPAPAVLV